MFISHEEKKIDVTQNNVIWGDAKEWLPYIPSNSIDLIYIDPPFFSNKIYGVIWGNGYESRSFEDRWRGGVKHYTGWMRDKIIQAHRVLKPTGSILLHCDYHANHHLRMLLDEVFGENNFVNEIIWHYFMGGKAKKFYSRKHDNIYWYSKSQKFTFNYETKLRMLPKKPSLGNHKGLIEKDGVWFSKVGCDDVFDVSGVFNMSNEYIGYRTQKPEKLISQFVRQLSNKGDKVLDFFGGGGTTAKVAHDLGRKFITGDISPVAYRVIIDRLKEAGNSPRLVNPPLTRAEWLNINDTEFEKKICMFMGWIHNPSSKPVDGWIDKNKTIPVEIKNHSKPIGVKEIRNFAGNLNGLKGGVFVSWHYTSGCFEYVAELEKKEKKKIDLIFAHTIIGELVLSKQQMFEYQKLYSERVKESKQKVRIIKAS